MDFGDLMVCADRGIDAELVDRLAPYPSKNLPAARDTSGSTVLRAKRPQDEAYGIAHSRMERELLETARRSQPAKHRDKVQLRGVEYARESCTQALLPVWLLEYTYLMRGYRIAVNGATGKAAGAMPLSVFKVSLLVVAVLWASVFIAEPEAAVRVPLSIVEDLWRLIMKQLENG
jgi:hypothetical protein